MEFNSLLDLLNTGFTIIKNNFFILFCGGEYKKPKYEEPIPSSH